MYHAISNWFFYCTIDVTKAKSITVIGAWFYFNDIAAFIKLHVVQFY